MAVLSLNPRFTHFQVHPLIGGKKGRNAQVGECVRKTISQSSSGHRIEYIGHLFPKPWNLPLKPLSDAATIMYTYKPRFSLALFSLGRSLSRFAWVDFEVFFFHIRCFGLAEASKDPEITSLFGFGLLILFFVVIDWVGVAIVDD